ncbi:MAG: hypothetical protein DME26_08680 [Verrucomicrobia bacterium]|nr:MAG: hypothetical protein DME26_08680 [Verrucomicrobiota bacterium]
MEHSLVNDIAICIIVAWVLAVAAQLLKQPLILAYLVAGFAVGPHGTALVQSPASIKNISEIGLVLLLFMIGLEIDLKKMLSAGHVITVTAVSQIIGGGLLGLLFFWALGFDFGAGKLDALYLAVATTLSSTVIIVKILYDKRELDTLPGRLTLGILIIQDVFAILFLALQPNLQHPAVGVLLLSLGKAVLLVAVAFMASRYALPPVFHAVARLPELVQVGALAWCFLVAGLASWLGLSREMGALIAGVAISTFPYTLDVTAKVTSLRDFFVTLFFVALGMKIPTPTWTLAGWTVVLVLFVIISRILTVFWLLHRTRQGHRVSLLPAINLTQISEFSLVILTLGLEQGHIRSQTFEMSAYAFAALAVASTYAVTRSDALLRWLSPRLKKMGIADYLECLHEEEPAKAYPRIFLLGFSWTASSLLEEIARRDAELLKSLGVVDFNPIVNKELRRRGVRVIYGDISHRETLIHAGIEKAEIIIITLPNTVLKGTTNLRMVQQLRELNPTAQIVAHAELVREVSLLYEAGANYVNVPRIIEAQDLYGALKAAQQHLLDQKQTELETKLQGRDEVIP